MTFLPIAERELRVASRKRGTYWGRLVPAALALIVWCGVELLSSTAFVGMVGAGKFQFGVFMMLAFLYACAVGLFVTSDALSEEKREGTLGLLFLTDLRGYDVIAGKLVSHSIPAFYGLIAAFPMMAIPLLSGGLTGGEFWRTMLMLANTMFLSLSAGLLVSSVSRNAMRAMNGTLLLLLGLIFGCPLVDLALAGWNSTKSVAIFSLASPWYVLGNVNAYKLKDFWLSLGLEHVVAWSFLGLACLGVPRAWQEKSRSGAGPRKPALARWRYSSAAARRALLDRQPIFWLAARDRSPGRLIWALTILIAVAYYWSMAKFAEPMMAIFVFGPLMGVINFVLTVWMISQACRFFFDGRRNGALELILVTPVTPEEIIAGQWTALKRVIIGPTVALTAVYMAGGLLESLAMNNPLARAGVTNFGPAHIEVTNLIAGGITRIANLMAAGWFGMWLGLTERKAPTAIIKTFCYVIAIPALVIGFLRVAPLFALLATSGRYAWWISTAIYVALTVAKDVGFIFVAKANLSAHFRETVALDGRRAVQFKPRMLATNLQPPPLPGQPPVIR